MDLPEARPQHWTPKEKILMTVKPLSRSVPRVTTVALALMSAFALTACSGDTEEVATDTSVEDIHDDVGSYVGQEVTVLAEVETILSPFAFTITGTEDPASEPVLVVEADEWSDLEPSVPVEVFGEVQAAFVLVAFEEEIGQDLDDDFYADWEGLPYIISEHSERANP